MGCIYQIISPQPPHDLTSSWLNGFGSEPHEIAMGMILAFALMCLVPMILVQRWRARQPS